MPQSAVNEAKIAESAYLMWLDAGQPHGQDQDFWFRAETALAKPATRKRAPAKKSVAAKAPTKRAAPKKAAKKNA